MARGDGEKQELADCIDSEHLKLLFYSAVQEGLRGSPELTCFHDCFFLGCFSATYRRSLTF